MCRSMLSTVIDSLCGISPVHERCEGSQAAGRKTASLESRDCRPGHRVGCGDHRTAGSSASHVDESWRCHERIGCDISRTLERKSTVTLQIEYEPQGVVEPVGVGSGRVATQSSIISPCRCMKRSDGQNSIDPARASQACPGTFNVTSVQQHQSLLTSGYTVLMHTWQIP